MAIICLALAVGACGGDDSSSSSSSSGSGGGGGSASSGNEIQKVAGAESKPTITVGSKNFTEQFILGELYAQALQAAGYKVKKELNLGSELLAYKALKSGKIDAYPEYTGTALTSFFGVKTTDVPRDAQKAYEDAKAGFAKDKITAPAPTPFEKTYGLKFGKFVSSEQKYQVLDSGDADVAFIFTTDGDLASGKYVILDDDKKFFPPYNVTFNVRNEAMKTLGPDGQNVVENIQKPLTEKVMQELNARVDVDKQKPEQAAKSYLQQAGFTK